MAARQADDPVVKQVQTLAVEEVAAVVQVADVAVGEEPAVSTVVGAVDSAWESALRSLGGDS